MHTACLVCRRPAPLLRTCQSSSHPSHGDHHQVNGRPTHSALILALALLSKVGPLEIMFLVPWYLAKYRSPGCPAFCMPCSLSASPCRTRTGEERTKRNRTGQARKGVFPKFLNPCLARHARIHDHVDAQRSRGPPLPSPQLVQGSTSVHARAGNCICVCVCVCLLRLCLRLCLCLVLRMRLRLHLDYTCGACSLHLHLQLQCP